MNLNKTCYICHQPTPQKVDDLRLALNSVLVEKDFQPVYTNQAYEGNTILFGICKNIYLADLCVFELAKSYPQIYIEIGIALAFNKPIIVIAEKGTPISPALQGHVILVYDGYLDLGSQFGGAVGNTVNQIYPDYDDYCIFCNQSCEAMLVSQDKNSYLVMNRTGLLLRNDWEHINQITSSYFLSYRMYPKHLTEPGSYNRLCDIKKKVFSSRFSFCHPGNMSDESSYLGLGLAIGKAQPWILVRDINDRKWPDILNGMSTVNYESLKALSESLDSSIGGFTREVVPSEKKSEKTSGISRMPFWDQLSDWIASQSTKYLTAQAKSAGPLKLVRSSGTGVIDKYIIPPSGLTLGFNKTCDVVIDHEYASRLHAKITVGKSGNYYIEDLESKNGTYLNGKKIPSKQRIKLTVNSIIRIPGARFVVADDESNLFELTKQSSTKQRITGHLNKIDLPNEFPPGGNDDDDFSAILKVRLMPEGKDVSFAIQSYYRMGKILPEVQKYFQIETHDDYCFSLGNFELIDKSSLYNMLNLQNTPMVYLRTFANLVTAILTDYDFEITDPNTSLPCVNWVVSSPKTAAEANPQKYALFIKKTNITEKDIDDLQTSVKSISGAMSISILSLIVTTDVPDAITQNIKDRASQSKVGILNYATLRKSLINDAQTALRNLFSTTHVVK